MSCGGVFFFAVVDSEGERGYARRVGMGFDSGVVFEPEISGLDSGVDVESWIWNQIVVETTTHNLLLHNAQKLTAQKYRNETRNGDA